MEEKKVTGIDLDELKRAREEMYREMGISSVASQNNSLNESASVNSDFEDKESNNVEDLEGDEEIDEFSSNSVVEEQILGMIDDFISENEASSETNDEEKPVDDLNKEIQEKKYNHYSVLNDLKKDLSHYDAFSQFEINSFDDLNSAEEDDDAIIENDNFETEANEIIDSENSQEDLDENEDVLNKNDDSLDDLLEEINLLIEDVEDEIDEQNEVIDEIVEKDGLAEIDENSILDIDSLNLESDVEKTDEIIEEESLNQPTEEEKFETILEEPVKEEISNINESNEVQTEDLNDIFEEIINEEHNINVQEQKIVDAIEKNNSQNAIKIANERPENKNIEVENVIIDYSHHKVEKELKQEILPEIDTINFVNVLSMQDFKNSDNFTFVLGRSESGNIIFENLKQCYNIAFFANEHSYELLNSMLLSFMLKNSATEFKLALCDGLTANNFAFYEGSRYLHDSKIAKGEDEIIEKLDKIIIELESRYKTLAKFNVKSVDEYNILAKNTRTPKLSQILIVIDGYNELMTTSSFEKIKSSLYQILRLGRIAGIYAIVVTNQKIEEDIINFNLPSRIGFKCSQKDDSISMIGELGIDKIANKNEYFYSSINTEHAQHLRQPSISGSIIKILIDNIEN